MLVPFLTSDSLPYRNVQPAGERETSSTWSRWIFTEVGCTPSIPSHQILGPVTPNMLRPIIMFSGLSQDELLQTVTAETSPLGIGRF